MMHFYAESDSERAKKGQGGNKFLWTTVSIDGIGEVQVQLERVGDFGRVRVYSNEELNGFQKLIYECKRPLDIENERRKGEKQKGECGLMKGYDVCDNVNCTHPLTA